MKRTLSLWSTLALLPATAKLAFAGSFLAAIYAASFVVTLLYHASAETRWRKLDHAFAYSVIAANTWMCAHSRHPDLTGAGVVCVMAALIAYLDAKNHPERYDASHAIWHVISGVAGACFAFAYA